VIWNWWRQGRARWAARRRTMTASSPSQTDFTEDLVMHGDDDQIVPYADSAPLSAKLLKNGILKTYKRLSARHAHDRGRHHQRRPVGLYQRLEIVEVRDYG
jgi:hypothetical protein